MSGVVPVGCEFPEEEVKDVIAKLGSVIQYLHSRFICVRFDSVARWLPEH